MLLLLLIINLLKGVVMIIRFKLSLAVLYIFVLLFAVSVLTSCAGGSQIPPVVCEYGSLVCETADVLCQTIPAIPLEVCNWIELACLNLTILCEFDPGTPEHVKAVDALTSVNEKLRQWVLTKNNSMQKE